MISDSLRVISISLLAYEYVPGYGGFTEENRERLQHMWRSLGSNVKSCAVKMAEGLSPKKRWFAGDPEDFCEELEWFLEGFPQTAQSVGDRFEWKSRLKNYPETLEILSIDDQGVTFTRKAPWGKRTDTYPVKDFKDLVDSGVFKPI